MNLDLSRFWLQFLQDSKQDLRVAKSEDKNPHPCVSCGACCAVYRVSFAQKECEQGYKVPPELTYNEGQGVRSLKTKSPQNLRCLALRGQIGYAVSCSIYESRPSPCRKFEASYENGIHRPRCDEARATHGLRPLSLEDWQRRQGVESLQDLGK